MIDRYVLSDNLGAPLEIGRTLLKGSVTNPMCVSVYNSVMGKNKPCVRDHITVSQFFFQP